jgi:AcrR family transcriptional regulator
MPKKRSDDTKPQRRDPAATRRKLLTAARREFANSGLAGARVDEIAARAGVNKQLVYHYFGDKDALYLAVLEWVYEEIRTQERKLNLEGLPPQQAIKKLIESSFDHLATHPDFIVLLNSGLLTLDRQWNSSIQVTSNPVLRQLMVLFLSKLIGRNTRPLVLTVSTQLTDDRCFLELKWKAHDDSQSPIQDAKNIIAKELTYIHELVYSIGGELILSDGRPEILLKLPTAPQNDRQDLVH